MRTVTNTSHWCSIKYIPRIYQGFNKALPRLYHVFVSHNQVFPHILNKKCKKTLYIFRSSN